MPIDAATAALSDSQKAGLRQLAANAAHHAYAPYSHFHVGVALLLSTGQTITGVNVENASYRLTCCAEQAAIARAVAEYGPAIQLSAVAIANLNDAPCAPCGACRQTLAEFGEDTTLILFPGENLEPQEMTLGALFPEGFRLRKPANHA